MFPFPVLLGDVGGTNARFALLPEAGGTPLPLPRQITGRFPGPVEAIRCALQGAPSPRSALLAVAAQVSGPVVRLTNADWTLDAGRIAAELGLARVVLVNDFVPVAAALPDLERARSGLARLGPALPPAQGRRLVLGAGTGFGAAALLPARDHIVVQTTEAGHVDLGPATPDEAGLWPRLAEGLERVSVETLLSGPGLPRLHRALAGGEAPCRTPNEVIETGLAGRDAHAAEALRLFVRLIGRVAGDLALLFGASGGVFIAGGIAPRLLDLLRGPEFRAAFERKAPFDGYLRTIPAWVVTEPDPALIGLAALATAFDRFILDSAEWSG